MNTHFFFGRTMGVLGVLTLLLFSSFIIKACEPNNKPCKSHEVCYKGIGCVPVVETHATAALNITYQIRCFNVIIDTALTPTLRCVGHTECQYKERSSLCGKVVDIDQCHSPPLLTHRDGFARQGEKIQCKNGIPCDPRGGCFGSAPKPEVIFVCCGVCINLALTPTLQCISFNDNQCSCVGHKHCPQIVDTDLCYDKVSMPSITTTSCAAQGDPIRCLNGQSCIPKIGCTTQLHTSLSLTKQDTSNDGDDRTRMTAFFIAYGFMFFAVAIGVAYLLLK